MRKIFLILTKKQLIKYFNNTKIIQFNSVLINLMLLGKR
jgi:hypothetical protein